MLCHGPPAAAPASGFAVREAPRRSVSWTVMACHVPPCSRRLCRRPVPAYRSSIALHRRPPRFPGAGGTLFRACARLRLAARVSRRRAYRAPDCARAREANAGSGGGAAPAGVMDHGPPRPPASRLRRVSAPRSRRQCHGLSCCVMGRRAAPASGFAVREAPAQCVMECHILSCSALPLPLFRRSVPAYRSSAAPRSVCAAARPGFPARWNPFPRAYRAGARLRLAARVTRRRGSRA